MTEVRTSTAADAAASWRGAAGEIQRQLTGLKQYLSSLDDLRANVEPVRLQALMTAYDIYALMLNEALLGVASDLDGEESDEQRVVGNHAWLAELDAATDGLFGPTGVLGTLARAMNVGWASQSEARWSTRVR